MLPLKLELVIMCDVFGHGRLVVIGVHLYRFHQVTYPQYRTSEAARRVYRDRQHRCLCVRIPRAVVQYGVEWVNST